MSLIAACGRCNGKQGAGRRRSPEWWCPTRPLTCRTGTTEAVDLRTLVTTRRGVDAAAPLLGAALTLTFAYEASIHGAVVGLGALVGIAALAATVYAFLVIPHIAVALTI